MSFSSRCDQYDFMQGRILTSVTSAVRGSVRALMTTAATSSGWISNSGLYFLCSISWTIACIGLAVRPMNQDVDAPNVLLQVRDQLCDIRIKPEIRLVARGTIRGLLGD